MKKEFVMPVKTGIQVRFRFNFRNPLDPASAGMTGRELQVDNLKTSGLEPNVVRCPN
jgi:hypothetical protein